MGASEKRYAREKTRPLVEMNEMTEIAQRFAHVYARACLYVFVATRVNKYVSNYVSVFVRV